MRCGAPPLAQHPLMCNQQCVTMVEGNVLGAVVGDILPLAIGIAISPIPIIAAILMLLSPKAKGTKNDTKRLWDVTREISVRV